MRTGHSHRLLRLRRAHDDHRQLDGTPNSHRDYFSAVGSTAAGHVENVLAGNDNVIVDQPPRLQQVGGPEDRRQPEHPQAQHDRGRRRDRPPTGTATPSPETISPTLAVKLGYGEVGATERAFLPPYRCHPWRGRRKAAGIHVLATASLPGDHRQPVRTSRARRHLHRSPPEQSSTATTANDNHELGIDAVAGRVIDPDGDRATGNGNPTAVPQRVLPVAAAGVRGLVPPAAA